MHICGVYSQVLIRVRDAYGLYFVVGQAASCIVCDSSLPSPHSELFWYIPFCSFLMIQLTSGTGGPQHRKGGKAKKINGME